MTNEQFCDQPTDKAILGEGCSLPIRMKYVSMQGGITCGAIDEPRKSSKVIDERVIINFCDKNVVNARFRDKNGGFIF